MDFRGVYFIGEWASELEKREKRNRPTEEKVCTDLFLLNSSRFNQQIIDLIKWHPLLWQEPARSMQISQAKKKKKYAHALYITNQTQKFHVCFHAVRTTVKQIPHSQPSHQKQIQAETEEQDQGAELQHKIQSGDRADRTRQKLPTHNRPSLHITEILPLAGRGSKLRGQNIQATTLPLKKLLKLPDCHAEE